MEKQRQWHRRVTAAFLSILSAHSFLSELGSDPSGVHFLSQGLLTQKRYDYTHLGSPQH